MRNEEKLVREYVRLSIENNRKLHEGLESLVMPLIDLVAPTAIEKIFKTPGTALKWIAATNPTAWPALFALWVVKKGTGFNAEEEINKLGKDIPEKDKAALVKAAKTAAQGKVDGSSITAAKGALTTAK